MRPERQDLSALTGLLGGGKAPAAAGAGGGMFASSNTT